MQLNSSLRTLAAVLALLSVGVWLLARAQSNQEAGPRSSEVRKRRVLEPPTAAANSASDLVTYPNQQVAFICGPQLKANSKLNPFPWFDSTELKYAHVLGKESPTIAPTVLTGVVSASSNSPVITGQGTRFLAEVNPGDSAPRYNGWLRIRDGTDYREVKVASVQSDTRLTLTSAWGFGSVRGAAADTYHRDATLAAWNYDRYFDSNYYDLALTEYIAYYRTGDSAYLSYARKIADAWWSSSYIANGTVTAGANNLPPRSMAYAGLMLRALDGRPEMWDYLERQVRATFDQWLKRNRNNASLFYDLREDGYAQLYAVLLARVLPDQYPLYANGSLAASTGIVRDGPRKRAAFLADAEDIAVNFFGRLQQVDGSWRWDIEGDQVRNTEQPFLVGLYLESAVLLHQLTTSTPVRTSLREQITRACQHLYRDAYRGAERIKDMPQYRWRGMFYFWGGGTTSSPQAYARGKGEQVTQGNPGMIQQVRHLNSTLHHAFGYAYAITRDEQYLRMGDEVFDASYGERVDGLHCLADDGRGKDYAMNFRASGRYLVWRLRAGAATP
jgi:hypothetical protein